MKTIFVVTLSDQGYRYTYAQTLHPHVRNVKHSLLDQLLSLHDGRHEIVDHFILLLMSVPPEQTEVLLRDTGDTYFDGWQITVHQIPYDETRWEIANTFKDFPPRA
jgi:hypothetical protein